jgi:hypothetical protein
MAVNPAGGAPCPRRTGPAASISPGRRPGSRYAVISPARIKVSESSCLLYPPRVRSAEDPIGSHEEHAKEQEVRDDTAEPRADERVHVACGQALEHADGHRPHDAARDAIETADHHECPTSRRSSTRLKASANATMATPAKMKAARALSRLRDRPCLGTPSSAHRME